MAKKIDLALAEALVEKKLKSQAELDPILQEADAQGVSLQLLLVKKGFFSEKDILNILAEKLRLSCVELSGIAIDKAVLEKVPVKVASYYKFMPVRIKDRILTLAVANPLDLKTQDEIRTQLGYDLEMVLSSAGNINDALKKYYGLAADTLGDILPAKIDAGENNYEKVEDIEKMAEDASVIKLVNQIILEAHRKRATDIHIEPFREGVVFRYRIDGLLYDANIPSEVKNFLKAIISRIKIMSNLNIVERRLPQDGRAIVKVQDQMLDLRISTMPTPFGESVVIRILPTKMLFGLEKLGLGKNQLPIFESLIKKPHGIVFVTGPTGSGKTTTLYACLSRINTKDRKIITIEDPIEYEMAGITQIQVLSEIGLDFARGLRSILRHDPDVVMVGEVRDFETAETAIRMALTGHLVFSTLHTNDAASAISRLIDIGVEPYLLASSVEAFIAQRLIRVVCDECKFEDQDAAPELKKLIAKDLGLSSFEEVKIFRGKGCNACNFTGFFGRTAIYEILLVDEDIRDLILKKSASEQIKKSAVSKGMRTLRQDGWQKILSGLTTPEEVIKVTSVEEYLEVKKEPAVVTADFPKEETRTDPSDRRIYSRLSYEAKMVYRTFKSPDELIKRGGSPEQFSATKNISASGLLFVSTEALPVGTVIELKVELPDGEKPVECLAKVVRVESTSLENIYDLAVCFLDLTGADRVRLNKFVQRSSS